MESDEANSGGMKPYDIAFNLANNMVVAYFYDHFIDPNTYNDADEEGRLNLEVGPIFRSHMAFTDASLTPEIDTIRTRASVLLNDAGADVSSSFDLGEDTVKAILSNFKSEDIPPGAAMTSLAPIFPERVMNIEVLNFFLTKCHGFHILRLWLRPPEGALYVVPSRIILDIFLPWLSRTGYIQNLLSKDIEYLADSKLGETLNFLSRHPKMTSADRELCKAIIEKYWNAISSADSETKLAQRIKVVGDASMGNPAKRRMTTGSARREARKAQLTKNRK